MKLSTLFFIFCFLQYSIAQEITEAYCECDKLVAKLSPSGQWIEQQGVVHETWCDHYRVGSAEQPNILLQNLPPEMQQLNSLIDLFNTPNTDSKRLVEQEAARKKISEKKAIEDKKRLDRIVRNEKLKNEMKPIEFVPFQSSPAPETMEDREIQNLINKGVKFNTGDFSSGSGIGRIEESPETEAPTESEKTFYELMNKVESYNNFGKVAALIGRSVYGIGKESINYMLDAGTAITTNDMGTMQELADIDGKKLVVNGVMDGVKITAKSYYDGAISGAKDKIYDAAYTENFALLKTASIPLLEKYKIIYPVSNEWKVPLRNYIYQKK